MKRLVNALIGCWLSGSRHVSSAIWQSSLTMATSQPLTPTSPSFTSTAFHSGSLTDCLGCKPHITQLACMETRFCTRLSTLLAVIVCGAVLFWLFREQVIVLLPWLVSTDPYLGFVVFFILFVLISLPSSIPGYLILNIAAGYRYGLTLGTMIVIVCALGGAYFAFVLCRLTCAAFLLSKLQNDYLQAIVNSVGGEHSFRVIALTRLTPIPFGLQNSVFAMANVSVATFVSATAIGLFPNQLLNSYLGSTLRSVQDITNHQWNNSPVIIVQVCLSISLSCYVIAKAQRHLHKTIHDHKVNQLENLTVHVIPAPLPGVTSAGSEFRGDDRVAINGGVKVGLMIENENAKMKESIMQRDSNQNSFDKLVT